MTTFGAVPNDGLDDTIAIQSALDAAQTPGAAGKIVYLPSGVYDVTDTLLVTDRRETNRVTLMGESEATTIIRLGQSTPGFTDPASPKPVVRTTSFGGFTAVQFRQSVQDLTIEVDTGNSGAIGLEYHTNNQGFIRDVTIVGDGVVGLSINGSDRGPGMLTRVTVDGFGTGIDAPGTEYSWVMEDITLRNQSREGIRNFWNILTIRGLDSTNTVPALWQDVETPNQFRWGMTTIIDATLSGGDPSTPALLANGSVYLRNVTSSGYATLIEQEGVAAGMTSVAGEFTSDRVQRLHPGADAMLNLPILDVPPLAPIGAGAVNAEAFGADGTDDDTIDDGPAIQAAIDSGADVVYLPAGEYHVASSIVIRGALQRIAGLSSTVTAIDALAASGDPIFVTDPAFAGTATVDNMEMKGTGTFVVRHNSPGTLAIRNITGGSSEALNGDFFLEDVVAGPHRVASPARAWYRQLNPENVGTKLINDGADAVVLGIKTEKTGRLVQNTGGRTEVLGGLAYPLSVDLGEPMFVNDNGELSAIIGESAYGATTPTRIPDYRVIVDDTRNNELRRITDREVPRRVGFGLGARMSFFTSNTMPSAALAPERAAFPLEIFTNGRTGSAIGAFDLELRDGAVQGPGLIGQGVVLDGTGWCFFTPDAPTLPLADAGGAVELWVKSDETFTDSAMIFYAAGLRNGQGNGFGSDPELHLHFFQGGEIGFFIESSAGDVSIATDHAFNDGAWHHVVASWSADGPADLYVNGVREGTETRTLDGSTYQSVTLGRPNASGRRLVGSIDEVTLWDRPITHNEVLSRFINARGFANYAPMVEAGTHQVVQTSTASWPSDASVNDDGQPFGATLTTQWTLDDGPGSVSTSAPSIAPIFTFPGGGTYTLRLTADDTIEAVSDTVTYTVFDPLPAPWRNDDVNSTNAGWATTPDGIDFEVNGAGSRISGNPNSGGDSFHYVYQESFSTDALEITATVFPPTGAGPNAKAGVMLRGGQREYIPEIDLQVISNVAENGFIGLNASGDLLYQNRSGNNGGTAIRTIETGITCPVHVRLVRTSTNRAIAFYALDCGPWIELEEVVVNRGQPQIYVGLAVAGDNGVATARFDDVEVRASAPGDVNGDRRLDFFDVALHLTQRATGDPAADFDGSGTTNNADTLAVIEAITPTCSSR